jgi:hypothetical protein
MMSDASLSDLLARVETLEATISRLTAQPPSAARPADAESHAATPAEGGRRDRRDLLRLGSLALGAAAVGLAPRSAEAANGGPVLIGMTNEGTAATQLNMTEVNGTALIARGTAATGTSVGVIGDSFSPGPGSGGVFGTAHSATAFVIGVGGTSFSSDGVGVFGKAQSVTGGNVGVWGETRSADGFGVLGLNPGGHGVVGVTAGAGGAAVLGFDSGVADALAGFFLGSVLVTGDHTVLGTKSAAVPHPDGSHRLLYCLESPESWFEDFGKAQLHGGIADVVLDPEFTAVTNMDDYHVFVTPYDEHAALMVSERTPCGFRIVARDRTSGAQFSWRVVAKRKDVAAARLARVSIPPAPDMPSR